MQAHRWQGCSASGEGWGHGIHRDFCGSSDTWASLHISCFQTLRLFQGFLLLLSVMSIRAFHCSLGLCVWNKITERALPGKDYILNRSENLWVDLKKSYKTGRRIWGRWSELREPNRVVVGTQWITNNITGRYCGKCLLFDYFSTIFNQKVWIVYFLQQ